MVVLLLYVPFIQDFAVQTASEKLSEALDMNIKVEQLRLGFPAKLHIKNLNFSPKEGNQTPLSSTQLNGRIGELSAELQLSPMLNDRLSLKDLELKDLALNYADSLGTSKASAQLKQLELNALDCDLKSERVLLDALTTKGLKVHYTSTGSSPEDDNSEALKWQIQANNIKLLESELSLTMPKDSIYLRANIAELSLEENQLNLEQTALSFKKLALKTPKLDYSIDGRKSRLPYLDHQHLDLQDIKLSLSNFDAELNTEPKLAFQLKEFKFRERSGFRLKSLSTATAINKGGIKLSDIRLRTAHSKLDGDVYLEKSSLSKIETAQGKIQSEFSLSPKDIYLLSGIRLETFIKGEKNLSQAPTEQKLKKKWTAPINAKIKAQGTLEKLSIQQLNLNWDKVLSCESKGQVSLMNKANKPSGKLNVSLLCKEEAQSLLALALTKEQAQRYKLPNGLKVKGDISFRGNQYKTELKAIEREGAMTLQGFYNQQSGASDLDIKLDSLDLKQFLPQDSLGLISGKLKLKSNNLNFKRPKQLKGKLMLQLDEVHYTDKILKDISLEGQVQKGELNLALNSFNKGFNLSLLMDGLLHEGGLSSSLNLNAEDLDPYYWGFVGIPLSTKFKLQGELFSDLGLKHRLEVQLSDLKLHIDDKEIKPEEVKVKLQTDEKACKANLSSGDLLCDLQLSSPLDSLQIQVDNFLNSTKLLGQETLEETEQGQNNIKELLAQLPEAELAFSMGKKNALRPYLAQFRLSVEEAMLKLSNSKKKGLRGSAEIKQIRKNALRINEIKANLESLNWDSKGAERLALSLDVNKEKFRHQEPFRIKARLESTLDSAELKTQIWGKNKEEIQNLNLNVNWLGKALKLHIPQEKVILAGHKMRVNPNNFIRLNKASKLIGGSINLIGEKRDGIYLSATDTIAGKQLGTIRLSQIDLAHYLEHFAPQVGGLLSADLSYERQGDLIALPMITGDVSINKLSYEGKELGHFASALFYQPRDDNSHYLTAEVSYAGVQSLSLDGIYRPEHKSKEIECRIALLDFPLVLANPFISTFDIALMGKANGSLNVGGALAKPSFNGEILGKEAGIDLKAYSSMFELDKQPLKIKNGTLRFDNYALLSQANPNNALYLNGSCKLVSPKGALTDINITADELLLFDTKEAKDDVQLLYGKLLASANLQLLGKGADLKLRGGLSIDNGTNCHYIMKDSPLQLTDNMSEVVSFSDFADTLFTAEPLLLDNQESATDINIGITIEPSVRFTVDLDRNGSDFLTTSGGGRLQLSSPPYGETRLLGRYEMNGAGKLRYTIPVVGQKTFELDPSSYVSFNGDMFNPLIKLKANYKMKANVSNGDKNEKVRFVVSMNILNSLEDLDLSFDCSAPENLKVQNDIRRMTKQERNKQALSLLTTGIYIAKGNNNLNNALTAILESRLNAVTNTLLKDTDFNLGMELNNGTNGDVYTNYTYSFSKGFYDERLRFVIGGKVQVGKSNKTNREQSFIDNIALQYQLDKRAEQHLKLYYKRVLDDILEGEYTETGLGYMMKRKLRRFSDLFRLFKKRKPKPKAKVIKVENFQLPVATGGKEEQNTIIQSSQ